MRSYLVDSPRAAGRILALTMIVDGNLAKAEIEAMDRSKILGHIHLDQADFQEVLQELCDDLLILNSQDTIQIGDGLIDRLLEEIKQPDLRSRLLRAMWSIADADGWLADAEAILLTRASNAWAAETGFKGPARTVS